MNYKEKCLKIIELAYSDSFSEEQLYKLLYDVVKSNALKKRIFNNSDYYDDFSHHMAGSLYMRLIDKTKPPIKSISNYINTTLKGFYDDFARYEFSQIIDPKYMDNEAEVRYGLEEFIKNQVLQQDDAYNDIYLNEYIHKMPKCIKTILEESGYTPDKLQFKQLYDSVILSMIEEKEVTFKIDADLKAIFPLILTDIKSRLNKDIQENLKPDTIPVDDLSYILYSMEANDE